MSDGNGQASDPTMVSGRALLRSIPAWRGTPGANPGEEAGEVLGDTPTKLKPLRRMRSVVGLVNLAFSPDDRMPS
jgi:hypothetical protein